MSLALKHEGVINTSLSSNHQLPPKQSRLVALSFLIITAESAEPGGFSDMSRTPCYR